MEQNSMVLLAHPGTQYSYHLARELWTRGYLGAFHTSFVLAANSSFDAWIARTASLFGLGRNVQNRFVDSIPRSKLQRYPLLELRAYWQLWRRQTAVAAFRDRNERFQCAIPRDVIQAADIVVGFDTSSRILAERTKALDRVFILDRSIGHSRSFEQVRALLSEQYPEWIDAGEAKSKQDLALEDQEHELADLIVVPSRFVARTLLEHGVPASKVRINPFGTDLTLFRPAETRAEKTTARGLTFTFVGTLSARKGLPVLLEAWQRLRINNAILQVVGYGSIPDSARQIAPETVQWVGAVSRPQLSCILQRTDVFVFPSFFEGLAQVQLEAAACGLPVIGTTASGAEEIVIPGETGFIVEPGDVEGLSEALERFLAVPSQCCSMRVAARERADLWSWAHYGDRWESVLKEVT